MARAATVVPDTCHQPRETPSWPLVTGTGQAEAYPHCMAGADGGGVGWNWLPMQVHVTPGLTGALFLSIQCRVEGHADRVGEKHGVGKVDLRV